MIACYAHRKNGVPKQIRLPDPRSHTKMFLVEIGRKLHLPGRNQLVDVDTFQALGFTHITDQNGKTIYPAEPLRRRQDDKGNRKKEHFRRPHYALPYRPAAFAIAQAA